MNTWHCDNCGREADDEQKPKATLTVRSEVNFWRVFRYCANCYKSEQVIVDLTVETGGIFNTKAVP